MHVLVHTIFYMWHIYIYIQSGNSVDAEGKFQAVKQSNQNLIHDRGKYWFFLQASIPLLGSTQPPI